MIVPTDKQMIPVIQEKIDNLSKPKGSLGRLESLAVQMALIQQTLHPQLKHPCHILFGGDHGIEREGVTCTPREVTAQQMMNYAGGGGAVGMFCRQHGFTLRVVDAGVDYDFDLELYPRIIDRKIAHGTRDFLYEPAMSADEWHRALAVGAEQVDVCADEGANVICLGEMGAGNTSPSSILMHLLLDIPLPDCVGAGSGLDAPGIRHKLEVLTAAVERYKKLGAFGAMDNYQLSIINRRQTESHQACLNGRGAKEEGEANYPLPIAPKAHEVARYFAGFEMAAAVGAMLRAAERRMVVMVDGFIMTACMLVASRLDSAVLDYAVFGHCGDEGGHRLMLDAMGAQPLLHLGMRLGEGTGALCAYPIVESAVRMLNDMDSFDHAHITKYF
ncbi:MAG: nicotinate-nucleotide--dimethylbenzimidazole phosphoribosyltransferase [Bacteroidaceae bacterium]|nr:nicotinate-nucleotide--dimethylbenzimidazole phosphoribosyltransferase [Bacteroidaceae bacterium]